VEAVSPCRIDAEGVERVLELLASPGNEPGPALDGELRSLVDLLARLRMPGDEPGEDQRLRLRARLREPALDEKDVQALLHLPALGGSDGEPVDDFGQHRGIG